MAVIDLNNLIKPKQISNPYTNISTVVTSKSPVYVDLHLDLELNQNIGVGLKTSQSTDIVTDTDIQAIRNSLKNIFTTKKGQMLLSPDFGTNLEQFLFEPVNDTYAKVIGNAILNGIENYEPRINVLSVNVIQDPENSLYKITLIYEFINIKNKSYSANIIAELGGQVTI